MATKKQLYWSTVPSKTDPNTTTHNGTIEAFREFVAQVYGNTKDGLAFCGAHFEDNYRKRSNVTAVDFLMLDFDDIEDLAVIEPLQGFAYYAYSSYSYGIPEKGEGQRFRMLLPLARSVDADGYDLLWDRVNQMVGGALDAGARDASRLNYLRRTKAPDATKAPWDKDNLNAPLLDPWDLDGWDLREERKQREAEREQQRKKADARRKEMASRSDDEKFGWVDSALAAIPASSPPLNYEDYRDICFALKDGEAEGLPNARYLWETWSKTSGGERSKDRRINKMWGSASAGGGVSLGSLWHIAEEFGWTPPVKPLTDYSKAEDYFREFKRGKLKWGDSPVEAASEPEPQEKAERVKQFVLDYHGKHVERVMPNDRRSHEEACDHLRYALIKMAKGEHFDEWCCYEMGTGAIRSSAKHWQTHDWAALVRYYFGFINGQGLVYDRDQAWYCDLDGIWRELTEETIQSEIARWSLQTKTVDVEEDDEGKPVKDESGKNKLKPPNRTYVNIKYLPSIAKQAITLIKARDSREFTFNNAPYGVAIEGQFHHLDGTVETLKPEHYQLEQVIHADDALSKAEAYQVMDNYFDSTFAGAEDMAERKQLLLEVMGAGIMNAGTAPAFQKALIVQGPKGSGKSSLMNAYMDILPPSFTSIVNLADIGQRFQANDLRKSRLNLCTELGNERGVKNADTVKRVIQGEEYEGEYKGKDVVKIKPRAAHMYAVNDGQLPSVSGVDEAFGDRFMAMTFDRRIRGTKHEIKGMSQRLARASRALIPEAIRAAQQAYSRKSYTVVPSGEDIISEWLSSADTAGQFITECLVQCESVLESVTTGKAYKGYQVFAKEAGIRNPYGRSNFRSAMTRHGAQIRKSGSERYVGYKLTEEMEARLAHLQWPTSNQVDEHEQAMAAMARFSRGNGKIPRNGH